MNHSVSAIELFGNVYNKVACICAGLYIIQDTRLVAPDLNFAGYYLRDGNAV